MKKIFRKNQVVITTLAFLIAIAGYISYDRTGAATTEESTEAAANAEASAEDGAYDIALAGDSESVETIRTTEVEGVLNPGEAVLTSTVTSSTDYASEIKLNREQVRSKNKETLNAIIENEGLTDEQKTEAVAQLAAITDIAEKEVEAESLLEAKGFTSVVVSITDDTCDVVLDMGEVTDAKLSQVEDIVKRKTGVEAENIIITAINTAEETSIESVD